jgi:hypothetical protein
MRRARAALRRAVGLVRIRFPDRAPRLADIAVAHAM